MSIATEKWTDTNRFNQTGYSAGTLFPLKENYKDQKLFEEDLGKAQMREEAHIEFVQEQRDEWLEELRMDADKCDCDYDCDEDDDCDE